MFERRLKIILGILCVMVGALLLRAAQVQLLEGNYWKQQIGDAMKRSHLLETSRGEILDIHGRVLAEDRPCIDACVDFRAISSEPDPKWLATEVDRRLAAQLGDPYKDASPAERKRMRAEETAKVRTDLQQMWEVLAAVSGQSLDDIDALRESIIRRVQMQQRYAWYYNFKKATQAAGAASKEEAGWKRWLLDGGSDALDPDKYMVTVGEQLEPHVILSAIDNDTQNELGKHIDRYPGLSLRPGTHRYYPYGDVACHVLGHLSRADREDLERQSRDSADLLRQYLNNDLVGKTGIEALCEPTLRGTRGRTDNVIGDDKVVSMVEPVPGRDVRTSIDIDLQQQIQGAFSDARLRNSEGNVVETTVLHGAAIVIDVATNQVRAMVSYPTYDENELDRNYTVLAADELNHPMMNRATMSQAEPGSTVKPMVGLSAITAGVQGVDATIECTGYLKLDGHVYGVGRCWVASEYEKTLGREGVKHHPVPVPHPTGFLTFGDGLERSCNVFFETTADRLGIDRLCFWYDRFGLGRPTGIGLTEVRGRLPLFYPLPQWKRRSAGFFAGIGEGLIAATPIQMANVAATVARGGIWMRPTLLAPADGDALPTTRPGAIPDGPDRVDLHLDPAAVAEARDGMWRVVNGAAGTGTKLVVGDELLKHAMIAAKTGTAQTSPLQIHVLDAAGKPVLDEHGKPTFRLLALSTPDRPNPLAPWYRGGAEGKDVCHAWCIGFAPRDHPQVAFAVLVEYGGSGGITAASVAREALEGCIAHGYLTVPPQSVAAGAP